MLNLNEPVFVGSRILCAKVFFC